MRRFIFSIFLTILVFASLTVHAAEVKALKGVAVVKAESLNVRSGPSKDYDKLGVLVKDTVVEVRGIVEPDWYVIIFEEKEGYISSQYVDFTLQDEIEGEAEFVTKKYIVMGLVVAILIVSGIIVATFISLKRDEEEIPITEHDDTNMHMGEVTYDTYRIDIDPKFFEQTSFLPQPESIDKRSALDKELSKNEFTLELQKKEQSTSDTDIESLDSKLEQASAQIAALQKEVEQLKKQKTEI